MLIYVKCFHKIVLFLHFIQVPKQLVQIVPLVTEIRDVEENVCSILYNINLYEKYDQYENKLIIKTILYFQILRLDTKFCVN